MADNNVVFQARQGLLIEIGKFHVLNNIMENHARALLFLLAINSDSFSINAKKLRPDRNEEFMSLKIEDKRIHIDKMRLSDIMYCINRNMQLPTQLHQINLEIVKERNDFAHSLTKNDVFSMSSTTKMKMMSEQLAEKSVLVKAVSDGLYEMQSIVLRKSFIRNGIEK